MNCTNWKNLQKKRLLTAPSEKISSVSLLHGYNCSGVFDSYFIAMVNKAKATKFGLKANALTSLVPIIIQQMTVSR